MGVHRSLARDPREGRRRFPVADKLREVAAGLSQDTALVVVFPPNYVNFLPPPGTEPAYRDAACKRAITEAARTHARSAIVDWRVRRPENQQASQYFDMSHYRQPIAGALEKDIARALAELN